MGSSSRIVVATLVLIITAAIGYAVGIRDFIAINSLLRQLETQLEKQATRIETQSQKLQVSEVKLQTVEASNKKLEEEVKLLTEKNYQLGEKLSLYQKVMDSDKRLAGVFIDTLYLQPLKEANRYRLTAVLMQKGQKSPSVAGNLQLSLKGSKSAKPVELNHKTLRGNRDSQLPFSFRYFTEIETELTLPAGFTPESLVATINLTKGQVKGGKNKKSMAFSFDWVSSLELPEYLN